MGEIGKMGNLRKSKKGIFFTIIAVMLVAILAIAFAPEEYTTFKDRLPAVKTRVDVANEYVKILRNSYIEASAQTSGMDAMKALVLYVNKTGYLPDEKAVSSTFKEIMLNGSINGRLVETYLDSSSAYSVMHGRTFFHKIGAVENASRETLLIETSFRKNLSDYDIVLYQSNETGPWRIGVNITLSYYVNASLASWDITQTEITTFPAEGILDPLQLVSGANNISRVERTNSTVWNIANVSKLIEDQKYKQDSSAPSFLMRLYGNLSIGSGSVCCGIESPINPNKIGVDINKCTRKSYIDWCFYSANCAPDAAGKIWNITGITTYTAGQKFYGFKLDTSHAAAYNITGSITGEMGSVAC
ncbi:hypothetical protein HYU15_03330 [Candidatus Woesearchaeota archaeon]|nr:hypothetical protein [Candidatus Woesearchaeota archaeon]